MGNMDKKDISKVISEINFHDRDDTEPIKESNEPVPSFGKTMGGHFSIDGTLMEPDELEDARAAFKKAGIAAKYADSKRKRGLKDFVVEDQREKAGFLSNVER
jgi:hypothetical protein